MENQTKKYPYCGEEILAEAKKCKHCGEWLEESNANNAIESTNAQNESEMCAENKGHIVGAVIGGIVAALISAILWCVVTSLTDYESGFYAIGVGAIVGLSVRWIGRGDNLTFGIVAALCAIASCIGAELYLSTIYYNIEIDFLSVVFWLVAATEAYYFARDKNDEDEDE